MNRLFLKLLGLLLLANLVTAAAVFVLVRPWMDNPLSARSVQAWGAQAITAYEDGGRAALLRNLGELHRQEHVMGMLYDPSGRPLLRRVARELRLRLPERPHHDAGRPGHDNQLVQWLDGRKGRYRWVVVAIPPSARDFAQLRLIASLAGIVLAAWLVAWWLTRPIAQLRHTTAEMAQGKLSARVPGKLTRRRDELGQLGEEFNTMAARLQQQVETKQQLLRDVSHELRSPLARLEVALEMARGHADGSERGQQALDRIALESGRLDALLEQVLTYSRLEQDQRKLNREPTDMAALLRECAADMALTSTVPIEVDAPEDLIIDADPILMRSVAENLLRNAQHYTRAGTSVQATLASNNNMTTLSVRDQGPGVPEDMLEAIFQPFVRTSSARDRNSGGHGIGLAIVARACQMHGGSVEARNLPQGGMEVTARLPVTA
ncbi:MAG: ATP-binding protein [Rhodanobacteraceae bacterium]